MYSFINNDEKECLTVLVTANAAGSMVPPMVLFSYARLPQSIVYSMPLNWGIGRSDKGWQTSETFFEFVSNVFYPWLLKENILLPVVLFVDGHTSHLTLHLSEFCQSNGIILVALFPNSTHLIQPMDVSVFRPLKSYWKKAIHKWRIDNNGAKLKREQFAPLLSSIFPEIKKETVSNGFKKCGIFPFNPDAIDYSLIKNAASIVDINNSTINNLSLSQPATNSTTININEYLILFESMVGQQKIYEFKSSGEVWQGNIEDTSLFFVWKKFTDIKYAEFIIEDRIVS